MQILTKPMYTIVIAITLCDDYQINSWLTMSEIFALQSIISSLIILLILLIITLNLNSEVAQVQVQDKYTPYLLRLTGHCFNL